MHMNAKTERVEFAHVLRGIAALIVVFSHIFTAFWEFPQMVARATNAPELHLILPTITKILLLDGRLSCLDYGRFGVAVFFLISGFVIPFSLKRYSRL